VTRWPSVPLPWLVEMGNAVVWPGASLTQRRNACLTAIMRTSPVPARHTCPLLHTHDQSSPSSPHKKTLLVRITPSAFVAMYIGNQHTQRSSWACHVLLHHDAKPTQSPDLYLWKPPPSWSYMPPAAIACRLNRLMPSMRDADGVGSRPSRFCFLLLVLDCGTASVDCRAAQLHTTCQWTLHSRVFDTPAPRQMTGALTCCGFKAGWPAALDPTSQLFFAHNTHLALTLLCTSHLYTFASGPPT
jgi:hypothetical protein